MVQCLIYSYMYCQKNDFDYLVLAQWFNFFFVIFSEVIYGQAITESFFHVYV